MLTECVAIELRAGSKMPVMLRPKGKAKKVAYSILGIPDNMRYKKTQKQIERDQKLTASMGVNYYR